MYTIMWVVEFQVKHIMQIKHIMQVEQMILVKLLIMIINIVVNHLEQQPSQQQVRLQLNLQQVNQQFIEVNIRLFVLFDHIQHIVM